MTYTQWLTSTATAAEYRTGFEKKGNILSFPTFIFIIFSLFFLLDDVSSFSIYLA